MGVYGGKLDGFPPEVVEKMLEYQVAQGNYKDVSMLESRHTRTKAEGGFDWDATPEGSSFWSQVIFRGNFAVFFKKYPNAHYNDWLDKFINL